MARIKEIKLEVVIVGGGMITHDQILPSLYHLQRLGVVGKIKISALNAAPLKVLAEEKIFQKAFPGQKFQPFPDFTRVKPSQQFPQLYQEVIRNQKPLNVVIVAVPDDFHYLVIKEALANNQHVLTVKPLVLKYQQAVEIEKIAYEKGLFVGVEYHKRFDRRSLETRGAYQEGRFGEFKIGEAKLIEPWYYRHSNFQNWFTIERTDPFTYIGCHYVDLVYFITGLKPVEVSVRGIKGKFPNGKEGFLWATGVVRFENNSLLNVITGLGYPDQAAGSNDQNMVLFCEDGKKGALIKHNDQFRGVSHAYVKPGFLDKYFYFINPDFFRLVPWEGEGLKPVGYGYDSIEANLKSIQKMMEMTVGLKKLAALKKRQKLLEEIDRKGIIATPANSFINELTIEAARESILNEGRWVEIVYQPEKKSFVRLKE
jgi:predicted dehydrogenase